jgi:hypothetical protein
LRLHALAGGGRGAVQDDRHDHDREAGVERGADILGRQRLDHHLAKAGRGDQCGDGHHRQRRHDGLVDAKHDGALGHWQ